MRVIMIMLFVLFMMMAVRLMTVQRIPCLSLQSLVVNYKRKMNSVLSPANRPRQSLSSRGPTQKNGL